MRTGREMNRSVAASLQSAIKALRRIPGTEARQRKLHVQIATASESYRMRN